jgi:hypothetical protein
MNTCLICKRPLGTAPELQDCGGDCLECMAEAGDPDAQVEMYRILQERRGGLMAETDKGLMSENYAAAATIAPGDESS